MKTINKILNYYLNQKIKFESISFLLNLIIYTLLYILFLIQVEYYFYLSPHIKKNIIKLSYIVIFTLLIFLILKIIIHKFNFYKNSSKLEIAHELSKKISVKDRIVNVIQIYSNLDKNNPYNDLSKKAIIDTEKQLKKINLKKIKFNYNFKYKYIILMFLMFLFTSIIISDHYYKSLNRLKNKNKFYVKPTPFNIKIKPQLKKIFKGDDFKVEIEGDGILPNEIEIYWQSNDGVISNDRIFRKKNSFNYTLSKIKTDLKIWAKFNNNSIIPFNKYYVKTDTLNVKANKRPEIKKLEVKIIYPEYTNKKNLIHNNTISHIDIIKGSTIKIKGTTNQKMKKSNIIFNNETFFDMEINDNIISYDFVANNEESFELLCYDYNGDKSIGIKYYINVIEDQNPQVFIYNPIKDLEINNNDKINISYEMSDDFGLSKAILEYQIKVFDNNQFKTGIGKSRLLRAYFPTLEDLFFEVEKEQTNINEAFEYISDSMDEVKDIYQEITDEVLKEKMGWEQEENTNKMINEIIDITNKMHELEETIQSIEDLNDNNDLINDILGEKIQQLQEMFKNAISPELLEILQNLQNSINKEEMKDAIKELNKLDFEMIDLETQLDRMIELFEELVIEQKLDELIKTIEQMDLHQKNISTTIKNNEKNSNIETMNQEQNDNLDNLQNNIDEVSRLVKKKDKNTSKSLDNLKNDIVFKAFKENINEISNNNELEKTSIKIEKNIDDIKNELEKIINNYNEKNTIEMLNLYSKIIKNLIDMSFQQEDIINESKSIKTKKDVKLKEVNIEQNILLQQYKNLFKQISELSKKSFYIKSNISKTYSLVFINLSKTIDAYEQGNIVIGKKYQNLVMRKLNETALLFLDAMKEMQNSNSPSGYNEYLEKMQEIGKGQQSINQEMKGLMPIPFGQQPGGQDLLSSLIKQQQKLMEELKSMMEGKDGSNGKGKVGEELGDAIQDMEDMINDFNKNIIDEESIERGKRIYQKLLNHSKSLKNKGEKNTWKTEKINKNLLNNNKIIEIEKKYNEQINNLYQTLDNVRNNNEINIDNKKIIEDYLKLLIKEKNNEKE